MATTTHTARLGLTDLIARLDAAVTDRNDERCCLGVKDALISSIGEGLDIEARFLEPQPDRYARHLLHRDPAGRYTVIAMVWGPGQGTPLHDHAGIWCVECVYQGHLNVTSYSVRGGDPHTGVVQFAQEKMISAGVGEAGALIPPFEYHTLANAEATPSVTIHVYGGEMTHCHIFVPLADGSGHKREYRELCYTPTRAA
jgi:predicted metal-dependent enzyme (double-stranded beta helix superfamily)